MIRMLGIVPMNGTLEASARVCKLPNSGGNTRRFHGTGNQKIQERGRNCRLRTRTNELLQPEMNCRNSTLQFELLYMNIQLGKLGVALINGLRESACEQKGASQRDRQLVQEHANTGWMEGTEGPGN